MKRQLYRGNFSYMEDSCLWILNLISIHLSLSINQNYFNHIIFQLMLQVFNSSPMDKTFRGQSVIFIFHIIFVDQEDGKVTFFVGSKYKVFKAINDFHNFLEMTNRTHSIIEFLRSHENFCPIVPPKMPFPVVTLILHIHDREAVLSKISPQKVLFSRL